ncbi:MAG: SAM hydrolase/SAM-dependent halogenase family protein [Thermoguttaceae bacterium]
MSVITLTTDFGTGSPYVAAMKGAILSINPAVTLVDITHDISPHDIRHGAVVLGDVTGLFPPGTIHVAVVDPGVGTSRPIVYAQVGDQQYVVPDNGLLGELFRRTPAQRIVRVENPQFWRQPVSATFHGRDIMGPVAAHLSLGVSPERLGPAVDSIYSLELPRPQVRPGRIDGIILEVDSFGNLITNITADMLAGYPTDERVCIVCGIYETFGILSAYAQQHADMFVALVGSTGRLELAIVQGNAAKRLGLHAGMPVTVAW